MLEKILSTGLTENMLSYERRRVRAANSVALVLAGMLAIPFTILSWVHFPPIAFSPLLGIVVGGVYFALTKAGHTRLARFILVVAPALQVTHYNAMLCGPEGSPLTTLTFVSMVFIIMAFVVVDTREKELLILTVSSSGMAILLLPLVKQWVVIDLEHTAARLAFVALLEHGWMSHVAYFVAIVAASSAMLGLSRISRSAEQESEAARQEAEENSEAMRQEKLMADETLKKLEEAQHTENQRRWAAEGIAQLTNLTRAHSNDKGSALYDQVIIHFVKYLEANQGGLYTINRENEETEIHLEACYAYNRKKYLQKTIAPGEGLVGQVFLEREPVRLTEVPENYVNITSGLGKATPRALAIVPLIVNEAVEGILEIATFKVIEDHHLKFLEKAGESLAAFIQMNRINTKTRILLAEAQQQAEEMRAQEEEMRQNLEELAATQEEIHRKEQAYQSRIAELESQLAKS
jgi:hypothetical protein